MTINSSEFQLKDVSKIVLRQWKKETPPEENRTEAENRIFDFFSCVEKDFLDLSNLNLTSLPDIFNDFSSRLKRLFLNHNQLKTLPNTIGNLSALTELDLDSNKLSSLPDTIIHLTALKSLRINNKLITRFLDNSLTRWVKEPPLDPEENRTEAKDRILEFFSNEKEDLNLSELNLSSLPSIFDYPCFLYRLTELNLRSNKLTTLPDTIGNLPKLKYLYLSGNKLEALPDMRGMDVLYHLDLSSNKLTTLPDTIGNLPRLTYLCLAENKLEVLPDTMGNLSSLAHLDLDENELESLFDMSGMLELKELSLRKNKLKTLPDTIGNLPRLTYLYLDENKLEVLPDMMSGMDVLYHLDLSGNKLKTLPDTIAKLSRLKYLYLNKNKLETLPDMSGMQKLEELDLSKNKLTALPDTIGALSCLACLDLDENELESLPRTIGSLSSLTKLYISNNLTLSDVPEEILRLSRKCVITLDECNPSLATFLAILLERFAVARPGYRGPRVNYSVIKTEKFIEKLLEKLCLIIERGSIELLCLKKTEELCSWLERLSYIADFKNGGDLQKALATKVLDYLTQADANQKFREIFYTTIQDAATTCGDRMALSILHLGLAYQLATIDLKDAQTLADFLKGLWAINILEDFARYKIIALRFSNTEVDEVEVYLGYPIKLKQELNLPIDVQEMLFFDCSALQDEDLQDAKDFVLSKQKNQEEYLDFLMNHDTWIKALSVNYQKEYQSILREKTEAFELGKLDEEAIEQQFKKQLTALTETALQLNHREHTSKKQSKNLK